MISIFSDLEIHQQIIELHKKENEIMQTKLLEIAKFFDISEVIINTMQYQKEKNLNKISFLYNRIQKFIKRENFFNDLIKKVHDLKKKMKNLKNFNFDNCGFASNFSNVKTNFSESQIPSMDEINNKTVMNEIVSTIRLATHQITDDIFYYSHDVVNYVKNMEYSNSLIYRNLNHLKNDLQKIGNFFWRYIFFLLLTKMCFFWLIYFARFWKSIRKYKYFYSKSIKTREY